MKKDYKTINKEMERKLNEQLENEKTAVKKLEKINRDGSKQYIVIYDNKTEMYSIDVFNGIGTIQSDNDTKLNWNFINKQGYKEI